MAHVRQSGLGFTVKVLKLFYIVPSSLGSSPDRNRQVQQRAEGQRRLCEDRIGTGPPRPRTGVIYADLGYCVFSTFPLLSVSRVVEGF